MSILENDRHRVLGKIKLPWEEGLSLLCTASAGSEGSPYHCDGYNAYYALDFDRLWRGNIEPETKILSIADGVIKSIGANPDSLLGLFVEILHIGRVSSLYIHLKEIDKNIRTGKLIKQGMSIGLLGETGKAAGSHLHFQLLVDGFCLEKNKEAKPEPISGYSGLKTGQWYQSDNRLLNIDF